MMQVNFTSSLQKASRPVSFDSKKDGLSKNNMESPELYSELQDYKLAYHIACQRLAEQKINKELKALSACETYNCCELYKGSNQ